MLGKDRLSILILRFEASYDLSAGAMGQNCRNSALYGDRLSGAERAMKTDVLGIMHLGY